MTDLVGQSLGPYTITERIGAGGMAEVYKAFHTDLSVYRALKVIRPELTLAQGFRQRFHKEARSVASLRHPNIVQVHDLGTHGDSCYMVMEFIEGQDLRHVLHARGKIRPVREAVDLIVQVASALEYAHGRGLIHRDIKPENIMIASNGQPILTDFGISKILNGATQLTQTGGSVGTPAYMAPEQALATDEIGPPADVYALTIVLFELLTGRTPYQASTPVAAMVRSIKDPLPRPRSLAPDISETLERVIIKGAAKDVGERFPSVANLRDALIEALKDDSRAIADETVGIHAATQLARKRSPERLSRTLIAASVAAVAVGAAASYWSRTTRQAEQTSVVDSDARPATQLATVNDTVVEHTFDPPTDGPVEVRESAAALPPPVARENDAELSEPERNVSSGHVAAIDRSPTTADARAGAPTEVNTQGQADRTMATSAPAESLPVTASNEPETPALKPAASVAAVTMPSASSTGLTQVRKGETTQGDLISLFGGPNLTTFDEAGRETWIYERTQTQTDVRSSSQAAQATARLGLFFGSVEAGGSAGKAGSTSSMTTTSAVRSLTVIVKFAPNRTVHDYSIRETYF